MAHYGEILVNYTPEIDDLYTHMGNYFNNPTMVKTKVVDNKCVYMTKITCKLTNEYRYLIALILDDRLPLGANKQLGNLQWTEFHTRKMTENHPLAQHDYIPTRNTPLYTDIIKTSNNNDASVYECKAFPITISMLHNTKDIDNDTEYTNKGTIVSALETYETVITLL